jgi:hypothetical protein
MNKKVSFADRVALIGRAASDLRAILAIVEAEAKAMAEAQQRFAAKKPTKRRRSQPSSGWLQTRSPTGAGFGVFFWGATNTSFFQLARSARPTPETQPPTLSVGGAFFRSISAYVYNQTKLIRQRYTRVFAERSSHRRHSS